MSHKYKLHLLFGDVATARTVRRWGRGAMAGTFRLFCMLALSVLLIPLTPAQAVPFTVSANGTTYDQASGLTWMRCALGQTWVPGTGTAGTCTGTASTYTYDQAVALTGTVTFAGQSDWRLPNIRELQTIVDRSIYSPSIDSAAFPNTPSSCFWSSSPDSSNSSLAWCINFNYGSASNVVDANNYAQRSKYYAGRLVRGGQSSGSLLGITRPTSDYVDNGDLTVTHTPTNLTWKRCAQGQGWSGSTCVGIPSTYSFEQANALTGTTIFAGHSDWRLPTADELESLLDYSYGYPSSTINRSVFAEAPGTYFWSSSPYANNPSLAWFVYFSYGEIYYGERSASYKVRLVRGGRSFASWTMTASKVGTGSGSITSAPAGITCGSDCTESYATGTSVTLTATPASGSAFTGWGGDCSGASTTCTLSNVTANKSVTAAFSSLPPQVTSTTTAASDCFFNWAEKTQPTFFSPGGTASQTFSPYYFRYYSQSNSALATSSDNHTYYLGPLSGNSLLDIGLTSQWLMAAGCAGSNGVNVVGPNGVSITLPASSSSTSGNISISNGDATGLTRGTQRAVSAAYTINIADARSTQGDARYKLAIPLNGTVSDPDKLTISVKLTTGTIVPLLGEYDQASNTYQTEVNGLISGWNLQVIEDSQAQIFRGPQAATRSTGPSPRWATTTQWNACDAWSFRPSAPPSPAEAINAEEVDALRVVANDLCQKYSAMKFREPQLFISSKYGGRVVHIVYDSNICGSCYISSSVADTPPEDVEQFSKLGQIYMDYAKWKRKYYKDYQWSFAHIFAHELFHAVQWGYDSHSRRFKKHTGRRNPLGAEIIDWFSGHQAFIEGTATTVGMVYQKEGQFNGPNIWVRNGSPEPEVLNEYGSVSPFGAFGYDKQDFFAYVAKKYGNNSFAYLADLFEEISKQSQLIPRNAVVDCGTCGTFNADYENDNAIYRKAMDTSFNRSFGKGLAEVFATYAFDRAFHVSSASNLRDTDGALQPNQLRPDLFAGGSVPSGAFSALSPYESPYPIWPLSVHPFRPTISEADKASGKFTMVFSLTNGALAADKVSIYMVPELAGKAMLEKSVVVTRLDSPIEMSLTGADGIVVFVVNAMVEKHDKLDYPELKAFSVAVAITSLVPSSGAVGTTVTVTGTGFGATKGTLTFAGTTATVSSWTDTSITATVPSTLAVGYADVVVTAGGVPSNTKTFEVTNATSQTSSQYELYMTFIWGTSCSQGGYDYSLARRIPVTVADGRFIINMDTSYGSDTFHISATGTYDIGTTTSNRVFTISSGSWSGKLSVGTTGSASTTIAGTFSGQATGGVETGTFGGNFYTESITGTFAYPDCKGTARFPIKYFKKL